MSAPAPTEDGPLTFLLDENMPREVGAVFAIAGDAVLFVPDEYPREGRGPGARDVDWLPDAGTRGLVVLSRDRKIITRPDERQAVIDHKVRYFTFPEGQMVTEPLVRLFVAMRAEIRRIAAEVPGPTITRIGMMNNGLRLSLLHPVARNIEIVLPPEAMPPPVVRRKRKKRGG